MSLYILSCPNKHSAQRHTDTKQGSSITLCILTVLMCSSGLMPSTTSYRLSGIRNFLFVGYVFAQMYGQNIIWLNVIQLDSGQWFTHQHFFVIKLSIQFEYFFYAQKPVLKVAQAPLFTTT